VTEQIVDKQVRLDDLSELLGHMRRGEGKARNVQPKGEAGLKGQGTERAGRQGETGLEDNALKALQDKCREERPRVTIGGAKR